VRIDAAEGGMNLFGMATAMALAAAGFASQAFADHAMVTKAGTAAPEVASSQPAACGSIEDFFLTRCASGPTMHGIVDTGTPFIGTSARDMVGQPEHPDLRLVELEAKASQVVPHRWRHRSPLVANPFRKSFSLDDTCTRRTGRDAEEGCWSSYDMPYAAGLVAHGSRAWLNGQAVGNQLTTVENFQG
jgi:hypothetical protein